MPKEITLNDLPNFSSWPARLLGIEPWALRRKTAQEIIREFEKEKWGPVLKRLEALHGISSIKKVDQYIFKIMPKLLACRMNGKLELLSPAEFHYRYLGLIENVLKPLLPASALVDLGCGYGSLILNLAARKAFSEMCYIAADFVPSAVELTKEIGKRQRINIVTGRCDLGSVSITDLAIPEGAIIFTSYAAMYVPKLSDKFISTLLRFKPRAVVHFEPCYEHFDSSNLLGLMKRRYIELNGYNKNLVSLLHRQQDLKRIKILEERPDVIGNNPFCPASLLIWKPKKASI